MEFYLVSLFWRKKSKVTLYASRQLFCVYVKNSRNDFYFRITAGFIKSKSELSLVIWANVQYPMNIAIAGGGYVGPEVILGTGVWLRDNLDMKTVTLGV